MIVAVTGIGSGLGKTLLPKLQKGSNIEKIIGIDVANIEEQWDKVELFKADICDRDAMIEVLKGIDVLIHLAYIVIPVKLPSLKRIYEINVEGSMNVFRAAAENGVKKIIHLSSQSVYGHVQNCPRLVKEDAPRLGMKTSNFYYSHTKALVEEFLDEFEKQHPRIAVIRFRPPIIAGPHFLGNLGLLAPKKRWISIAPEKGEEQLGLQLIHEDDLTDLLLLAVTQNMHGAYNVAGNILEDVEEFVKREFDVKVRHIPRFLVKMGVRLGRLWLKLRWLQALLYHSLLDTEKIEQGIGWKAKYTTEECIREIKNGYEFR